MSSLNGGSDFSIFLLLLLFSTLMISAKHRSYPVKCNPFATLMCF